MIHTIEVQTFKLHILLNLYDFAYLTILRINKHIFNTIQSINCTFNMIDLDFFVGGGIVFFKFYDTNVKYLKTAQFINLDAGSMRGAGPSGPPLNQPLDII